MHDSRLSHQLARAIAAGCRVKSESETSVIVVRPRRISKLGVVILSLVFVFAGLLFGVDGFIVGAASLAIYVLVYLFQKERVFEIYLDEGEVKVRLCTSSD